MSLEVSRGVVDDDADALMLFQRKGEETLKCAEQMKTVKR